MLISDRHTYSHSRHHLSQQTDCFREPVAFTVGWMQLSRYALPLTDMFSLPGPVAARTRKHAHYSELLWIKPIVCVGIAHRSLFLSPCPPYHSSSGSPSRCTWDGDFSARSSSSLPSTIFPELQATRSSLVSLPKKFPIIYRLTALIGNISTMFHPRARWAFQKRQAAYGRVSTLYGLFGVSQANAARTAIH